MKQPRGAVVIKPGQCACCSKPVSSKNGCLWQSPGVWVHHTCLPRIIKGMR